MVQAARGPRVWLAGRACSLDADRVRDDQGRVWSRGDDGLYHDLSNRHHLSSGELSARSDLVEVEA